MTAGTLLQRGVAQDTDVILLTEWHHFVLNGSPQQAVGQLKTDSPVAAAYHIKQFIIGTTRPCTCTHTSTCTHIAVYQNTDASTTYMAGIECTRII